VCYNLAVDDAISIVVLLTVYNEKALNPVSTWLPGFSALWQYTTFGTASKEILYRMLCNDVQRKGIKSPGLASGLFCCTVLRKIGYGIAFTVRYI